MNRLLLLLLALNFLACKSTKISSTTPLSSPALSIAAKTAHMQKQEGYFNFYWEEKTGKIWLEIDKWNTEFLYVNSLATGVGSNDIGLDRGQLGENRVVKFVKRGPKILLVQVNYDYRAVSDNIQEQRSVEEAFAQSILWGFKESISKNGKTLVDASAFLLQDAHDVVGRLQGRKQGNYKLDASRSAIYLERCKAFPQNTEFEASLTFTGKPKGDWVYEVVPTPSAISVRQHHSFIQLPDDNYQLRASDPRTGCLFISYKDYATPIDEPLVKQFILRHRLEKKDPSAAKSEAVEPIIYYLDPGVPEPVRSALLDGARWWAAAFEEAGFIDAFQVKILPEDADPMDVRYNVIQWVHRSTRGWSYGGSVIDPRTGEILKGHVSLGSLRVRQDYLIAQGLLSPFEEGKQVSKLMKEMALARLRQLSAHEVGHTIGLAHNFAASGNGRASVMDYPHPYIQLDENNQIDFSEAYDDKIGLWDKRAIKYAYSHFPKNTDETAALDAILKENTALGLDYISDADARPAGGAHPYAHLWDNQKDAADELIRLLELRTVALNNFGINSIPNGTAMAALEEVLVPLYLAHRYQVEATSKLIGGLSYTYAVKGEAQVKNQIVDAFSQHKAIDALLASLQVDILSMPENLLELLPPKPPGLNRGRESFKIHTGLTFDPLGAAESAANHSLHFLLHPQRAARLVEYHARNTQNPSLKNVIDRLIEATFESEKVTGLDKEIEYTIQHLVVHHLISLATNTGSIQQVKAITYSKLKGLKTQLERQLSSADKIHYDFLITQLDHYFENPLTEHKVPAFQMPAGSPIGSCDWDCCRH